MPERKPRLTVPLEEETLTQLQAIAAELKLPVAEVARNAMMSGLASDGYAKTITHMSEDQLRLIIKEEVAALVKESIMSSVTLASQAKASDSLTADEVARIQENIDNALAKVIADVKSHRVI